MTFTARQVLTAAQLNDLSIDTLTTTGNVTVGGDLTVTGSFPATPPAGSDGQIQYNNGGSFGGASSLSYNDANGDLSIGQRLILSNSSVTGEPKITLYDNGSVTYGFAISSQDLDYLTDYNHRFHTGSGAGSLGSERFTILQNGNIGINNPAPSYALDVNGTSRFTNNVTVTGNFYVNGTYLSSGASDGNLSSPSTLIVQSATTTVRGSTRVYLRADVTDVIEIENRQSRLKYAAYQGLGQAGQITGTTFTVTYGFDNSSSARSIGATWTTIGSGSVSAIPKGTGYKFGSATSFTVWVLWGFSGYASAGGRRRTRIFNNSSTTDYYTSEQYFYYNVTSSHQGWSFFDTMSFRQDLGNLTFNIQVISDTGVFQMDANDYWWIWAFRA